MSLKTKTWDLLLDRPALLRLLEELPGYEFPAVTRAYICQAHMLTEAELTDVINLYGCTIRPSSRLAKYRPLGPSARTGLDLLLDLPELRSLLEKERLAPQINASHIVDRRKCFRLSRPEMVRVLNAHAEILSRA